MTTRSRRMAQEIRFDHGDIVLDGFAFPFYVADKPRIEVDPETGVHTVHLAVLCDRVTVDLSLSAEADAAVDASLARFPRESA